MYIGSQRRTHMYMYAMQILYKLKTQAQAICSHVNANARTDSN